MVRRLCCARWVSMLVLSVASLVMADRVSTRTVRANDVDRVLNEENKRQGVKAAAMPAASDLAFLRRIYVDMISRIPTEAEIREFEAWPAESRRERIIVKLMDDPRFVDRWTVFFEDMLRLRTNAAGGAALITFVHQAVADKLPYDELCRRLLVANGKAGRTPEVGFILGDDADPMAMASVTAQVFLGTRIGCAQCHDHPFDVWKREDFYGMAAFFGKTRRVESQLTRVIYTTEADQSTVMWPPEGEKTDEPRKAMTPRFPFQIEEDNGSLKFLTRLAKLRAPKEEKVAKASGPSVDDLLADADSKVKSRTSSNSPSLDLNADAKKEIRKIDIQASLQSQSQLRIKLAESVTNPRNRFFSRNIVNRIWKELIGRGFVEPVDDFRKDNPASHPATLDYLADEFVANGYDLRYLIGTIVRSDVYRRSRAPQEADEATRQELEVAFLATPMKRMISEALYDSIVTAGHLFEFKHPAGANELVTYEKIRVPKTADGKPAKVNAPALFGGRPMAGMTAMAGGGMGAGPGYALEDAIELDFTKVLVDEEEEVAVEQMRVMSREELEAERMMRDRMAKGDGVEYIEKTIKKVVDANPKFNTSLRMESPAPQGHFLRVFGQPTRQDLGEARDESATMRQALMMLNGRLTHEASRVGPLEPVASLLQGDKVDVGAAVKMAYREIMTREPSAEELAEAKAIVASAATPLDGMSDLRWVLLNCNEFRFLP